MSSSFGWAAAALFLASCAGAAEARGGIAARGAIAVTGRVAAIPRGPQSFRARGTIQRQPAYSRRVQAFHPLFAQRAPRRLGGRRFDRRRDVVYGGDGPSAPPAPPPYAGCVGPGIFDLGAAQRGSLPTVIYGTIPPCGADVDWRGGPGIYRLR